MTDVTNEELLIEAEDFDDYGGWVLDAQFDHEMGSPYLLAHGYGQPVADASTTIQIHRSGTYQVWVRAKDWVPSHHPGRFGLSLGSVKLEHEFGASGQDWNWERAESVDLDVGSITVRLHDLTGFDARCDAIYLSCNGQQPVDGSDPEARAWRRALRGLPQQPSDEEPFDVCLLYTSPSPRD